MRHWPVCLAMATSLCGCNAREACSTGLDTDAGIQVQSEAQTTELRLTPSDPDGGARLRVTLSGLPELWQDDGNVFSSAVTTSFQLAYEAEPRGFDGITQMPRIRAILRAPDRPSGNAFSDSFPGKGPDPSTGVTDIFRPCDDDADDRCCAFGARECRVELSLDVERLDQSPFPPVVVTLQTLASANVSACPMDRDVAAQLTVEQVSP
jgi:hypothetical protein